MVLYEAKIAVVSKNRANMETDKIVLRSQSRNDLGNRIV
jgi:hypothetical protein